METKRVKKKIRHKEWLMAGIPARLTAEESEH